MTKLLHMPTGLVGEVQDCTDSRLLVRLTETATICDSKENFKPLSEFDVEDLRSGDWVTSILVPKGFMFDSRVHVLNWKGVKSVTRAGEVIYERVEKSEVQQIIDEIRGSNIVGFPQNVHKLLDKLEALEAKRGAE